jgi:hypothetical protein
MSAFVRTSSRPVDMIFSIMGPMGVQLPVANFNANDRTKRPLSSYGKCLSKNSALWPSPELPILPAFPETSESDRAMINTPHRLKLALRRSD